MEVKPNLKPTLSPSVTVEKLDSILAFSDEKYGALKQQSNVVVQENRFSSLRKVIGNINERWGNHQ